MTRTLDEPLEDQSLVAERRLRLAAGGGELVAQLGGRADRPHALAAAAGGGLDEDRIADPARGADQGGVVLRVAVVAGDDRDAERPGRAGARRPCRPSPGSRPAAARSSGSRRLDGLGERGVLGEEAEARVDGIGCGSSSRRGDDGVDVEQVEGSGAVGRRDDRLTIPRRVAGALDSGARSRRGSRRRRDGSQDSVTDARGRAGSRPPRTRPTRQTRHAIDRRPGAPGADRRRSSAGRAASSRRSARRPGSGSARRTSLSRLSRPTPTRARRSRERPDAGRAIPPDQDHPEHDKRDRRADPDRPLRQSLAEELSRRRSRSRRRRPSRRSTRATSRGRPRASPASPSRASSCRRARRGRTPCRRSG